MAYLCFNDSIPADNYFAIYKKHGRFRIRINTEGSVKDLPLNNVTHSRDIIGIIKYHTQYMGLSTVSESISLDMDSIGRSANFKGNPTMFVINSSIGPLFVKKLHNISCHTCLTNYIVARGYNVLADMFGYITLRNDDHFDYGLILEQCYPVKQIDVPKILAALCSLNSYHVKNNGLIHGDCNPTNILCDKYGNLKLVDPVNLIEQNVRYRNADYYDDLKPETELQAFLFSCMEIAASIHECEVDELRLEITEFSEHPTINKTNGVLFTSVFKAEDEYNLIEIAKKMNCNHLKLYEEDKAYDEDYTDQTGDEIDDNYDPSELNNYDDGDD